MQIPSPVSAEIMADAGFDWVCVDLEHGAIGFSDAVDIIRALDGRATTPVVRLPSGDPYLMRQLLDVGAQGIIVPNVQDKNAFFSLAYCAFFPPKGRRGIGYCRANKYGEDFEHHLNSINHDICVIPQIESAQGVRMLSQLLKDGKDMIDGTFVGPLDLSGSLGHCGEMDHPQVQDYLKRYRTVCNDFNCPKGMHVVRPTPENVQKAIRDGYRMIALGLDTVFIAEKSKEILSWARG